MLTPPISIHKNGDHAEQTGQHAHPKDNMNVSGKHPEDSAGPEEKNSTERQGTQEQIHRLFALNHNFINRKSPAGSGEAFQHIQELPCIRQARTAYNISGLLE